MSVTAPLVTVVIATYNYSSVLRYALQSVLWQTFQDFEVWVIGDACTDDSEAVVASFGDPRIHWHNLPENSGNQAIPDNKGIALAQGKYIAYLGHDDLWHPEHLEGLVETLERTGADVAHTLAMFIRIEAPFRRLYGLWPKGEFEPTLLATPSSLAHRRDLTDDIGGWKDYRVIRIPPDVELVMRAFQKGKKFALAPYLTAFKFPGSQRPNVYIDKPTHEQAEYARRIQCEPDFRYRELLALIEEQEKIQPTFMMKFNPPATMRPGEMVEGYRLLRGLESKPAWQPTQLVDDVFSLVTFNPEADVTPEEDREALHTYYLFTTNGVLLGEGWHAVERDGHDHVFRWVNTNAQILITNPDGERKCLSIDVWPGYANKGNPITISLVADDGSVVGKATLKKQQRLCFEFTPPPVEAALYTLQVSNSLNLPLPNDPRILNFAVSKIRLSAVAPQR